MICSTIVEFLSVMILANSNNRRRIYNVHNLCQYKIEVLHSVELLMLVRQSMTFDNGPVLSVRHVNEKARQSEVSQFSD